MAKLLTGLKPSEKQFIDLFEQVLYMHPAWEVWSDLMLMIGCSISNAADKTHWEAREKQYLAAVQKYSKKEQALFPQMLAAITAALDHNPYQDFLGSLYMKLELWNHWKGQFFTPYNLCKMSAQISAQDVEGRIEEKGWTSVCDPCCGAGAYLIAFADAMTGKKINYQDHVLFVGQDIDHTAAMMCYIQLSLLGCPGYVKVGNTLSDPLTSKDHGREQMWYTPMYFLKVWHMRRIWQKVSNLFEGADSKEPKPDYIIEMEKQTPSFDLKSQPLGILEITADGELIEKEGGSGMLEKALELIGSQQGKDQDTHLFMIGEQLKDILKSQPEAAELVCQDMENPEFSLVKLEKRFDEFAAKHKKGCKAVIGPRDSDKLIRDFFGIPDRANGSRQEEPRPASTPEPGTNVLNFTLEDFM